MSDGKRNIWKDEEIKTMLAIIKENNIYTLLDSKIKRNKKVYEEIESKMKEKGFNNKCFMQIRNKFKLLKAEYCKIKRNNNQSGAQRETCMYYEDLDEILRFRPVANVEGIDTSTRDSTDMAIGTTIDAAESLEVILTEAKLEDAELNITQLEDDQQKEVQPQQIKHTIKTYKDAKRKSYESVLGSFSKQWKKDQDELIAKLKQQDEDMFKMEEGLLEQSKRDMLEILAVDRAETKKIVEMFLHSIQQQRNQVPVYSQMFRQAENSYRSSTTSSSSYRRRQSLPSLSIIPDNNLTKPIADPLQQ